MSTRQEIVEAYVAAWNTADPDTCRRLLELCFAVGATYTDPAAHLQGREALVAYCCELAAGRPGARVVLTGHVEDHHRVARFPFAVIAGDGAVLRAGVDFATFGPDGTLASIVAFFDT